MRILMTAMLPCYLSQAVGPTTIHLHAFQHVVYVHSQVSPSVLPSTIDLLLKLGVNNERVSCVFLNTVTHHIQCPRAQIIKG